MRRTGLIVAVIAAPYGCGSGADAPPAEVPGADATRGGSMPAAADTVPVQSVPGSAPDAPGAADPPAMSTSEADAPALPWTAQDTRVDRAGAGLAVLTDVRTARHEGYDRVVLEFGGTAVPGYSVAYIDRPVRQCGSGHTVPMDGDGWLQIEVTPARAHTDAGQPTITERSRRPGMPNVQQLELTCDFEGHVVWVAGVGSPAPYRVFELRAPARLVIDVRHAND